MVLPPSTRNAVAILVCIVAFGNLNYFHPPKDNKVMAVAETSFLCTACKYLAAVLLPQLDQSGTADANTVAGIGVFLVAIDVIMLIGTGTAVMLLFWHAKKQVISAEALPPTKVAPASESDPSVAGENREQVHTAAATPSANINPPLNPERQARLMHLAQSK